MFPCPPRPSSPPFSKDELEAFAAKAPKQDKPAVPDDLLPPRSEVGHVKEIRLSVQGEMVMTLLRVRFVSRGHLYKCFYTNGRGPRGS